MGLLKAGVLLLRAILVPKTALAIENLALRQQVAVYKQSVKRPQLRPRDRVFWVWLSRLWSHWRSATEIVQPETAPAHSSRSMVLVRRSPCRRLIGQSGHCLVRAQKDVIFT